MRDFLDQYIISRSITGSIQHGPHPLILLTIKSFREPSTREGYDPTHLVTNQTKQIHEIKFLLKIK